MATQNPREPARRPRHRRRRRGVPKALTIVLVILALVVGGGFGYVVGGRSQDGTVAERDTQLDNATRRIAELETTLNLMGIDPNADFFADLNPLDAAAASAFIGNIEELPDDAPIFTDEPLVEGEIIPPSEPVVVAEFGDVKIMSDEVLDLYNSRVNQVMMLGHDVSEFADSLMEESLESIIVEKIKERKAAELGLTELSDAEMAALDEQAQQDFDAMIGFYITDDEDVPADEQRAAAIEHLAQEGTTLENMREQVEIDYRETKLSDLVSADLTVSAEELQETYDRYLADQQEIFAENLQDYEFARRYGDEAVVFNPDGYRTFKQVLIAFAIEDSARAEEILDEIEALDAAEDAGQIDLLNGELETLYAKLQPTADEVLDRIAQGEDFDALIEEYGEDPEQDEPAVKRDGYYVSEDSDSYVPAITKAAMALAAPGDISDPIRTVAGLHILRYNFDVPAGAVPLDDVRDALTQETLDSMKYDAYDAQLAQWIEEAEIIYHREALQ